MVTQVCIYLWTFQLDNVTFWTLKKQTYFQHQQTVPTYVTIFEIKLTETHFAFGISSGTRLTFSCTDSISHSSKSNQAILCKKKEHKTLENSVDPT